MRTRHRQVELTLENQAAELAEQLRSTNTLLQQESAQMLDQSNALRQELHNHQLTQYVEECQMSTMRNTLEHQQKRSHNEELQFQAAKRQFHEQKVTLQNLQREVYRVTRSETSLQQQRERYPQGTVGTDCATGGRESVSSTLLTPLFFSGREGQQHFHSPTPGHSSSTWPVIQQGKVS